MGDAEVVVENVVVVSLPQPQKDTHISPLLQQLTHPLSVLSHQEQLAFLGSFTRGPNAVCSMTDSRPPCRRGRLSSVRGHKAVKAVMS